MRRFEREVVDYKLIEAILQEMTDTHLNVYEQEDDEVPFDISDIIADRKVRKDNSYAIKSLLLFLGKRNKMFKFM